MSSHPILPKIAAVSLLLALAAACSSGHGNTELTIGPAVISTAPADRATDVPRNASIRATFNEHMAPSSVNAQSFTVAGANAAPVQGTVLYTNQTAAFWPAVQLEANQTYIATITIGARSVAGVALRLNHTWRFTTGTAVEPGLGVNLGTAANYVVLAKSAISTVPASVITGDLGLSPAAASFVTGFALTMDASNQFSTSTQVTGSVFAADYAAPTPANLTTAVSDMETAFTDAAARAPGVTELGAGNIGGMTLVPGVYKWGTGLQIPTNVTLDGGSTGVWIFQIAQDLTVSSATSVLLTGGAQARNVFWQVSGMVDLGTTSSFQGHILTATAITMRTGASLHGRLLAQTAVSLDTNTIVEPVQ
jgi:hypothetical protein